MESSFKAVRRPESNRVPCNWNIAAHVSNAKLELGSGFGRFLAAKIEFSYGAWQTVNLLALRLQWFESTPTHGSYIAILQVLKPLGGHTFDVAT